MRPPSGRKGAAIPAPRQPEKNLPPLPTPRSQKSRVATKNTASASAKHQPPHTGHTSNALDRGSRDDLEREQVEQMRAVLRTKADREKLGTLEAEMRIRLEAEMRSRVEAEVRASVEKEMRARGQQGSSRKRKPGPSTGTRGDHRKRHASAHGDGSPSTHTQSASANDDLEDEIRELEDDPEADLEEVIDGAPKDTDEDDAHPDDAPNFTDEITPDMFNEMMAEIKAAEKRRYAIHSKNTPAAILRAIGRQLPRIYGPYIQYANLISVGLSFWSLGPPTQKQRQARIEAIARNSSFACIEQAVDKFQQLMFDVPWIELLFPYLVDRNQRVKTTRVFDIAAMMSSHARAARATDLHTLKGDLHKYLPQQVMADGTILPPPKPEECIKTRNFGSYSEYTARLLTAIEDIAKFDRDPQRYMERMQTPVGDGLKLIRAAKKTLPSFLYRPDVVTQYSARNPSNGVLQCNMLVQSYRHLVTGRTSALRKPGKRSNHRTSFSPLWNRSRVIPPHVAYVAALVGVPVPSTALHFLINEKDHWDSNDVGGAGQSLWDWIVKYLQKEEAEAEKMTEQDVEEDGKYPDTENLILWWNRQVYGTPFGDYHAITTAGLEDEDEDEDAPNVRQKALDTRAEQRRALREERALKRLAASQGSCSPPARNMSVPREHDNDPSPSQRHQPRDPGPSKAHQVLAPEPLAEQDDEEPTRQSRRARHLLRLTSSLEDEEPSEEENLVRPNDEDLTDLRPAVSHADNRDDDDDMYA
ncbi:hypothetical protein C8Q76DRAFT_688135 [Earliella scabrosa]|nr:hypothetical protein C8Q76DRAFT_688135 [Earliella scabrosa]